MDNNGTKHEKDVINSSQRQESNSHVDSERSIQEESQMFEEEVKNGVEFWNNGTDVTI